MAPQTPNGASLSRPEKATTRTGPSPASGVWKPPITRSRYSGCRASRPRASRLWVLPPPIAWVSLNTPWADFPSSRRKPSVSRVRIPSVT